MQLICPTGFYGAERWILALARHVPRHAIVCDLAVTSEDPGLEFELLNLYPRGDGARLRIEMSGRFDVRVVTRLARHCRDREVDVLHTHGYKSDVLGVLAARLAGIPVVATAHGYTPVSAFKDRLYHFAGNRALRRADRVVALSRQLCTEIRERGVAPARMGYIPNGVDVDEIEALAARADAARTFAVDQYERPVLGYVGQLVARKRVHLVLEAFDRLWRMDPDLRLEILGDGPERGALEALASTLPSCEAVRFRGFVAQRVDAMKRFALLMLASDNEGVPRVLMEAMVLGVPIVAVALPGVVELLRDEVDGLLVADPDPRQLAERARRVLDDAALAERLRDAASARVREHFSAVAMADAYALLYRDLAGCGPTMGEAGA